MTEETASKHDPQGGRIRHLEHEVKMLTNAGVIECMVRNPAVNERIGGLEREVAALTTQRDEANTRFEDHTKAVAEWTSTAAEIIGLGEHGKVTPDQILDQLIYGRQWASDMQTKLTAAEAELDELQKRIGYTAVPVAEVPLDPINVSLHHPESYCHKCGGRNITWFAPNELWNTYAGDSDIICPICFAKMAEEAGCNPTAWKLSTENLSELEEIRLALAGSDISSLPSDFPTVRMAHQIRADHDKFLWQIRDTCTRAETAEAELDAAKRALSEAGAVVPILLDLADCVYFALDDSEEIEDGFVVLDPELAHKLVEVTERMDALPDDMPGFVMSYNMKARWAIRALAAKSTEQKEEGLDLLGQPLHQSNGES